MPKVLLPVGDGTEVLDTLYPFFRLPEDGFEVVVAGPAARHYHGVMHEIPPDAAVGIADQIMHAIADRMQRYGPAMARAA